MWFSRSMIEYSAAQTRFLVIFYPFSKFNFRSFVCSFWVSGDVYYILIQVLGWRILTCFSLVCYSLNKFNIDLDNQGLTIQVIETDGSLLKIKLLKCKVIKHTFKRFDDQPQEDDAQKFYKLKWSRVQFELASETVQQMAQFLGLGHIQIKSS